MMGLQVENSKWWHYLVTSWGILNVQQLAAASKGRMTTNEGKQNSNNLKKKKKKASNSKTHKQMEIHLGGWMEN